MIYMFQSLILKGNPQTLEAKGKCGKDLQTLEILLPQNATVSFNFIETEKTYFISSLSIMIPLNSSNAGEKIIHITCYVGLKSVELKGVNRCI